MRTNAELAEVFDANPDSMSWQRILSQGAPPPTPLPNHPYHPAVKNKSQRLLPNIDYNHGKVNNHDTDRLINDYLY